MAGRLTMSNRFGGGGISISTSDDEDKKLDNPEAKKEAGLAMELDPGNDGYREWFERFQ